MLAFAAGGGSAGAACADMTIGQTRSKAREMNFMIRKWNRERSERMIYFVSAWAEGFTFFVKELKPYIKGTKDPTYEASALAGT